MIIPASQEKKGGFNSARTHVCDLCAVQVYKYKVQQGACSLSERVQPRLCGDADRSKQISTQIVSHMHSSKYR